MGGTVGYMAIEDFSFSDAFYMTIITVTTVGFQEVHPLSSYGKWFTAFLIVTSFSTFAYALTSITKNFLSGQYRQYFKVYKVNAQIQKLQDHVIICGYGRNGIQAAKSLEAHGKKFVIVESDQEILNELHNQQMLFVKGDATDEETLLEAGIKEASALITTLPKDADNVFVSLTAKDLNSQITLISRATDESAERKLKRAGVDNVIMPERVGGMHMASLVVTPDVYEFLDRISVIGSDEINLEEITFTNIPDDCKFKTLQHLSDHYHTGSLIIGYKTPQGEYVVNPALSRPVEEGAKIFVLGKADQIRDLNQLFTLDA